jgi:hypothetical protein
MAEHLFDDTFVVTRLNPDGKKFDKGIITSFPAAAGGSTNICFNFQGQVCRTVMYSFE